MIFMLYFIKIKVDIILTYILVFYYYNTKSSKINAQIDYLLKILHKQFINDNLIV